jgi:hypothetical protein
VVKGIGLGVLSVTVLFVEDVVDFIILDKLNVEHECGK